ncbi:MAG: rod shape-determining protein MreC [Holosporaceae bacterium]|nr:MAG: rod shape-determining protein MreC [Holosporaceae bacterium]
MFAQKARLIVMEIFHPIARLSHVPSKGVQHTKVKAHDWIFAYSKLQTLKQTVKEYKEREYYIQKLEHENAELRRLLNVTEAIHHVLKQSLSSHTQKTFVKSLLLGQGLNQGIMAQSPLVTQEGLVGRTVESSDNLTRALLITDLNSRVPIIIKPSNKHAILMGTNSDYPVLRYLPYGTEIKKGDIIRTSGSGGLFPAGIPVGTVEKVTADEAVVKPFAKLDSLSFVNILTHELNTFSSKFR